MATLSRRFMPPLRGREAAAGGARGRGSSKGRNNGSLPLCLLHSSGISYGQHTRVNPTTIAKQAKVSRTVSTKSRLGRVCRSSSRPPVAPHQLLPNPQQVDGAQRVVDGAAQPFAAQRLDASVEEQVLAAWEGVERVGVNVFAGV
jgi:hypothetical protein